MLHNEVCKFHIEAWIKTHNAKGISKCFSSSQKRMREKERNSFS